MEVQGTGNKHVLPEHKFKEKKLEALAKWNQLSEVVFWLWHEQTATWVMTSYVSIRMMIAQGKGTKEMFDGKRPFWAIPLQTVLDCNDQERLLNIYGT
jgi:penicillin-binding protein-related factor A (putative recombinase)